MLPRHFIPIAGLTAAALATTAPAAQAAATCKLVNGVLEVRMLDPGFARFAVVSDAIVVVVDQKASTCAGGPPTTANTNAVLLVDDSDYASTSTPHDGNSGVEISDPQTFAPGATPEPTGKPEVEFLLDMREGTDQLLITAPSAPATLVFGNDGANWNGDDDRDLTTIGFDVVRLFGGPGDDRISAGGGAGTGAPLTRVSNVEIRGGAGNDRLRGSDIPAVEPIHGEEGDDVLEGGEGPDGLAGGPGDDVLDGGGGVDRAGYFGAPAPVTVDLSRTDPQSTGQGRDTLVGIENVDGGVYSDTLIGNELANELRGAVGDDTLVGGGGSDVLRGGADSDTASFAGERGAVDVDIAANRARQGADIDAFESIENAIGSPFGDVLTGDAQANRLEGGAGPDTVVAGAGADRVEVRDGERDGVTCGADADAVSADQQTLEAIGPDCESVDVLPEPAPMPATGEPPVTPGPTLDVALTGARSQRLLRQKAVRAKVRCSLACTIAARAGAAKRVRTTLEPGVARKLKLRPSRRQLAALRRALAAGKRPSLRVEVEARDAAGTRVVRTLRVRAVRK